ncbi:TPA: lytic transglycosylase domain-containing protein, partial [Yersinia enterocolitica]|nr:transglycosylase SLT domain-containing protein [Yersinia enterocolitica]HEN3320589.1 transglycosylase SLT domain-containing protein [Yersinia enterocolitica]
RLLNINLKNWTLKGDIENLTKQFGEFGKMLSMIGDLINALKEGNWSEVGRIGKLLLSQGGDQPDAMPVVTDSANSAADWVKDKTGFDPRSVGRWLRGESNGTEPDQYAQSVKRPTASASGAALLGWLQPTLTKLEALNNLPAGLLRSVAITESGGNQFAISGAGAKGLFQFMNPTAKDMGLKGNDVFDPEKSAAAAAKYLSMLLKMNGGDLDKALASYNWGIGNVQKHGLDLMPPETRNYIP